MDAELMPTLFISHGAPTFALEPGLLGPRLTSLGRSMPRPRAVLVVSPHWMTRNVQVTRAASLDTIHDFGGFDEELYDLQYLASGAPDVADQTIGLLTSQGWSAKGNDQRGIDHGVWVPLLHLYPNADVPVVQVSMPAGLDAHTSYSLGLVLAPLRAQGVLIVGSGSLTHNLYEFRGGPHTEDAEYAREFAAWSRQTVLERDHERLLHTMELAPHARRAHPTTEHLLPLILAAGAAGASAPVTIIEGGISHGVLAMDSYAFGLNNQPH